MCDRSIYKVMRLLAVMVCVVLGGVFVGCSGARENNTLVVTSYVSTDTTVASATANVVKDVATSVVEIQTESVQVQWGMQYVVSGAGSGVIVAYERNFSNYYIITNNHVIAGARQIRVTIGEDKYTASLVAADAQSDIAVISINEVKALNVAVWGNSDSLSVGEDLIAIGNPLGELGGTVTKGILSAEKRLIPIGNYTMSLLQTDTAINPGNSGGGLFNMRGELVGIVNAKMTDEEIEGICFAIPANTAREIYDDLITYGIVRDRATLDISVEIYEAKNELYVYVTNASAYGDGEKFVKYDRIAEINGVSIKSLLNYNDAISSVKPGDTVTVTVYRGHVEQQPTWLGTVDVLVFDSSPTTFEVTAKAVTK